MVSIRSDGPSGVLLSDNNLVSFSQEMSEQERRDVIDCLRYSQSLANRKHSRHQAWGRWLNTYQAGLFNNGFTLSGALLYEILSISDARELRHVMGKAIEAAGHQALSGLAATALETMLDSHHAQSFFEGWFTAGRSESMQVVPCRRDAAGFVEVMICGLQMHTEEMAGSWFKRPTAQMTITIDGAAFIYSAQAYAPYREKIRKELKEYTVIYFDGLP